MSALDRIRHLFRREEPAPPPRQSSRDDPDEVTASHVLHSVVHEVTTTSRAASRTLRAKAAGLTAETHRARASLFPEST